MESFTGRGVRGVSFCSIFLFLGRTACPCQSISRCVPHSFADAAQDGSSQTPVPGASRPLAQKSRQTYPKRRQIAALRVRADYGRAPCKNSPLKRRHYPASNKNGWSLMLDPLEASRSMRFRGYTTISILRAWEAHLRVRARNSGLRNHRQAADARDEAIVRRRIVSRGQSMGRPSGTPGLGTL